MSTFRLRASTQYGIILILDTAAGFGASAWMYNHLVERRLMTYVVAADTQTGYLVFVASAVKKSTGGGAVFAYGGSPRNRPCRALDVQDNEVGVSARLSRASRPLPVTIKTGKTQEVRAIQEC